LTENSGIGSNLSACPIKTRQLSEFVIEGVKTTIPFHLRLMKDPNFRAGNFTTKFMDNFDLTE
jgi:acetyl-CoA carboxylase biotin carboxylase subunit